MTNTTPKGLGPEHNEYTVFAVYTENLQPYSTTVLCATPEKACCLAQAQCCTDNDPDGCYPEPTFNMDEMGNGWVESFGNFGDYTLTAYQVVLGKVKCVL